MKRKRQFSDKDQPTNIPTWLTNDTDLFDDDDYSGVDWDDLNDTDFDDHEDDFDEEVEDY